MAMKVIKPDLMRHPGAVARFIAEAQATAQLAHPGIVPVHELGKLDDGRHYFTMSEVQGRTFGEVISAVHAVSQDGRWQTTTDGWSFRRLLQELITARASLSAASRSPARGRGAFTAR